MNRVLFAVALIPLAQGCFLLGKKSGGSSGQPTAALVIRDGIFLDRTGDGDSARLNFKTSRAAICELSLYAQDPQTSPTKDKPLVKACSDQDKTGRTDIVEELSGLKTDTLYMVTIRAWEPATPNVVDSVLVKETADGTTPNGPGNSDGKLKDLIVARLDVPLKIAEIHHHELREGLPTSSIKAKLSQNIGCKSGAPDPSPPFRESTKDVLISHLATTDFAIGSATAHSDYPERLSLGYTGFNDTLGWTFSYLINAQSQKLTAKINRIVNFQIESSTAQSFADAHLAVNGETFTIDPSKPFKLTWTTNKNLPDMSYLGVQISRHDGSPAISCTFSAANGTAEIDSALIQGLGDGKYTVLAELASTQLFAKEGWLVSVYDWRSGRIQK